MPDVAKKTVEEFTPLWDYLLVKVVKKDDTTAGGVVIPEAVVDKKDLQLAEVVKAGKGAYRESGAFIPNPIKVGDLVYMMGHTYPFTVYLDEVEKTKQLYYCLAGRDVVAVARKPESTEQAEPGKG